MLPFVKVFPEISISLFNRTPIDKTILSLTCYKSLYYIISPAKFRPKIN